MRLLFCLILILCSYCKPGTLNEKIEVSDIERGWAANSINTVIFRKNSVVTAGDYQFTAYYDSSGIMVIAKRKSGTSDWEMNHTGIVANVKDAHNAISIMVDGSGYLHIAWDHHSNPLNYCQSIEPFSIMLSEKKIMTGTNEEKISYPEFYKLPGGNLLFFYRNGASGNGNLGIKTYDHKKQEWKDVQQNLIDGEGKRNAYWQASVDKKGSIHISWVWRESPDVASNHDLCYARSDDGGVTWKRSSGVLYSLPITINNAEIIQQIPQESELINQTSMTTDSGNEPYIATYWREKDNSIPQYHIVYKKDNEWKKKNLDFRKTAFTLKGGGTKRIPMSRPQIIINNANSVFLIFRDEERNNRPGVAIMKNINESNWEMIDLINEDLGSWEPTYDTELWKEKNILSLFIQKNNQADGEGITSTAPQMISILNWKYFKK